MCLVAVPSALTLRCSFPPILFSFFLLQDFLFRFNAFSDKNNFVDIVARILLRVADAVQLTAFGRSPGGVVDIITFLVL